MPGCCRSYRVLDRAARAEGIAEVICGTDTLGDGHQRADPPVLFTRLCKFDGQRTGILSARIFIKSAAGQGGKVLTTRAWVVAQAPEACDRKFETRGEVARDGKKNGEAPAAGKEFRHWDKNTYVRLIAAPPEKLTSRFKSRTACCFFLNVLSRQVMARPAIGSSSAIATKTPKQKKAPQAKGWQLFRSLVLDRKM